MTAIWLWFIFEGLGDKTIYDEFDLDISSVAKK